MIERRKKLRHKILVCDDDISFTELLRRQLLHAHYDSVIVHTGTDCLRFLKREFFQVVLLDNIFPCEERKGVDLIEDIQEISPGTKVILMTGHSNEHDMLQALNYGAGFIEKPFDLTKIMSKLRSVLAG